ncbi:MAG: hypothetical protein NC191_07145, partial [Muribaculaceae bacterium]|nr:hypothetical protein [Muribaculaceae bacterium]
VGIHSVGAYSGKPGGGALIIDADKVDEYAAKRRSIERKNKVLDWVMLVGSAGLATAAHETINFGGKFGKVLGAVVAGVSGLALLFKASKAYRCSQVGKLNDRMDVKYEESFRLALNPDYVKAEKPSRSCPPGHESCE